MEILKETVIVFTPKQVAPVEKSGLWSLNTYEIKGVVQSNSCIASVNKLISVEIGQHITGCEIKCIICYEREITAVDDPVLVNVTAIDRKSEGRTVNLLQVVAKCCRGRESKAVV